MTDNETTSADLLMADTSGDQPGSFLGIPLNRIVAFGGPYISVLAGSVATWLLTNVQVLGLFDLSKDQVAEAVTQLVIFSLTAGLTWLGQRKWLQGWQAYEQDVRNAGLYVQHALEEAPHTGPYNAAEAEAELAKHLTNGTD